MSASASRTAVRSPGGRGTAPCWGEQDAVPESAPGARLAPVPALAGQGVAVHAPALLRLAVGLHADDALDPLVPLERDDLDERCALRERVNAVVRHGDEREIDGGDVGVGVHEAAQDLEDAARAVERRDEQAAPARWRADRPGVVELHRRARLPGPARGLPGVVVAHHLAVELPARRDGLALVADLEPDGGRQRHDPPERHGVEERDAALHGQAVVRRRQRVSVDAGELLEPRRLDGLRRDRLRDHAPVLGLAEKLDVGARLSTGPRPHTLEPPPERSGDRCCYRHRFRERFEELLEELLDELLLEFELELLDEFELELFEEFELELLDELELELLDEFELELPADASCVYRADWTARITASGGELPTEPSVTAADATSPHAPSPAAYVFQFCGTLLRSSIIGPRFEWVQGYAPHWSPGRVRAR